MSLPVPSLDDRTYADIVRECLALVSRHCPEWTDQQASDPGVALVELFAHMTEMVIYRLNQVPENLHLRFLEMVGIELRTARAARAELLFRLVAAVTDVVKVPSGTLVSTPDGTDEPVVFATDRDLTITAPRLTTVLTRTSVSAPSGTPAGAYTDVSAQLSTGSAPVTLFTTGVAGDALYLGFSAALPSTLLRISVEATPHGAGVEPDRPPVRWQAWNGEEWAPVRVLLDDLGGFNRAGVVELLLPSSHEPLPIHDHRCWWLRCRLQNDPGDSTYDRSPRISAVRVEGIGGTTSAQHAEVMPGELLGVSDGRPAQTFLVRRRPVLARRLDEHLRLLLPGSSRSQPLWQDWTEVGDFSDARENDLLYTWSGATGEVRFGPRVRHADGSHTQYGALPPADAQVWVTSYRYGGGRRGNVGAGRLTTTRTSLPSLDTVENLDPAHGGADPESVEDARVRGTLELRSGRRAVTTADFERLTRDAVGDSIRVHCLAPATAADPVRVLVVPRVSVNPEDLRLSHMALPAELEDEIVSFLEERRLLTARVRVDTPSYRGVSVAARVRADRGVRRERVEATARSALYRHLDPLVGGADGRGWPFGMDLHLGEVHRLLSSVEGVAGVDQVLLSSVDPAKTGDSRRPAPRQDLAQIAPLDPGMLFLSYDHQVVVVS